MQHTRPRNISPLDLGLIEGPTRPRSEYTAAIRREALLTADAGNLAPAADLTLAAMTEDGYARGILDDLTEGLWGLPRTFSGNQEMIADLDDTPARVGQWRVMFPSPEAIRLSKWGITLGIGVGQMRRKYGTVAGEDYALSQEEIDSGAWKIIPKRLDRPIGAPDTRILRTWNPRGLTYQYADESWWMTVADGRIRIEPNDGEWLFYTPYGAIKPWEYGAWKSLTLAFILARDAIFDRARHSEVLAPVRVGKVPQGTTEKQRQKYLTLIREMQRMAMFVLPPGLEYSIVESTGKVADIYKAIVDWARGDFAMLTGSLTTATGSAGFSKGDVQERFTRSILAARGDSLSTCLHEGGLVPWAIENYGTEDAPRARFDASAPEDKEARARTVGIAGESIIKASAAAKEVGLRLTKPTVVEFFQKLGLATEDIPAGTAAVAKLSLGVDAMMAVVRGGPALDSLGLPRFNDERDDKTIADLLGKVPAAQPAPGAPTSTLASGENDEPDGDVELEAGEAAPPVDYAAELAAKMTEHKVPRCEHESNNRCWKCGIERARGFVPGKRGQPVIWQIAWRPIAAKSNGALSRPLLFGGDAGGDA